MASEGKGGNKGRAPTFSARDALTPSGASFKHAKRLQPVRTDDQGRLRGIFGHIIIPLKPKYRGYRGW